MTSEFDEAFSFEYKYSCWTQNSSTKRPQNLAVNEIVYSGRSFITQVIDYRKFIKEMMANEKKHKYEN